MSLAVLETARLRLRQFADDDAAFVLELLNEPAWLRFIGDRGVRTLDDARAYIESGPRAMFARHGFSLMVAERATDGAALGMCGLIKRDTLPAPDIGYAFLPRYWGQGYAREAVTLLLRYYFRELRFQKVTILIYSFNARSIRFHERFGFTESGVLRRVGWKHDAWHDVAYLQRDLGDPDAPAGPLQARV